MERVIGLGGPFIKADDPKTLAAWYEKHLGISFNGATYTDWQFTNSDGSKKPGYNVLSFFKKDAEYFAPSEKQVMVNFIVKDLFALIAVLKEEGIAMAGDPIDEVYGKFGWIIDPEGNKIELWEPPELIVYLGQLECYEKCEEIIEKTNGIAIGHTQIQRVVDVYGKEPAPTISGTRTLSPYKQKKCCMPK